MKYPLAHLIIQPAKPYVPMVSTDIRKTIAAAKKEGPLVGPVVRTRVAPLDLMHPMHSRFAVAGRKAG